MSEFKLSFCIPSYKNSEAIFLIVDNLLTNCDNYEFQVVICDDHSEDGTIDKLKTINDSRLKIVENTENIGATKNWLKTLRNGDGDWLYLVMGRDLLYANNIEKLLMLLKEAERNNVVFAYDRVSGNTEFRLLNQIDAIFSCLNPDHPTGMIFNRGIFEKLNNLDDYFAMDTIYPENYLKRDLISKYPNGIAMINGGVFSGAKTVSNYYRVRSKISGGSENQFFGVNGRFKLFCEIIEMCEFSGKFEFPKTKFTEIYNFFWWELSSIWVRESERWIESKKRSGHYNYKTRIVKVLEIINDQKNIYFSAIRHFGLIKLNFRSIHMLKCCIKEIINTVKEYEFSRYKHKRYSDMYYTWISSHQAGRDIDIYLDNNGYKNIIIYGMDSLGELIYRELCGKSKKIICVDESQEPRYLDYKIYKNIIEIDQDIDLIIVTDIINYENIQEKIGKKVTSEIISAEDLIYLI